MYHRTVHFGLVSQGLMQYAVIISWKQKFQLANSFLIFYFVCEHYGPSANSLILAR
jgi:hypothetical protein